jgi:hypothetical protein
VRVDARLADERHGFPERLNHRSSQKVARELDEVRRLRLVMYVECLLADRLEQRHAPLHDDRRSGGDDEQLSGGRSVRPPEDGRANERLLTRRVGSREALGKPNADGAHGNVDRAPAEACKDAGLVEGDRFDGGIVREHRDHGVSPTGVCNITRDMCALGGELGRFARRPIVDRHLVSGLEQIRRHGGAHVS